MSIQGDTYNNIIKEGEKNNSSFSEIIPEKYLIAILIPPPPKAGVT